MSSQTTDFIVEQVRLKEKVLGFLQAQDILKSVEQSCVILHQKHSSNKQPQNHCFDPIIVNLNLRFGNIDEAIILYLVIKETKYFIILSEEVIYCFVTNIFNNLGSKIAIELDQIHCNLRFHDLPLIQSYTFSLRKVHVNCSLTTFHCIIYSKNLIKQYVRQSVWKCEKCFGLPSIIHKNKDSEGTPHCQRCQNNCIEILSHCVTSRFLSARVFDLDTYKNCSHNNSSITSAIELKLYDDLCQELILGQEYIVTGIFEPVHNYYNVSNILPASEN